MDASNSLIILSLTAIDLKTGGDAVYNGDPRNGSASCTLTISDENFIAFAAGKLSGQQVIISASQGLLSYTKPFLWKISRRAINGSLESRDII